MFQILICKKITITVQSYHPHVAYRNFLFVLGSSRKKEREKENGEEREEKRVSSKSSKLGVNTDRSRDSHRV